jgi:hypothetical protein
MTTASNSDPEQDGVPATTSRHGGPEQQAAPQDDVTGLFDHGGNYEDRPLLDAGDPDLGT